MIAAGASVRVRDDWPEAREPCHVRTPWYLRGATGTVLRHLGEFPDPGALAFGRPAPIVALYHVSFDARAIWGDGSGGDEIMVELFQHWLE